MSETLHKQLQAVVRQSEDTMPGVNVKGHKALQIIEHVNETLRNAGLAIYVWHRIDENTEIGWYRDPTQADYRRGLCMRINGENTDGFEEAVNVEIVNNLPALFDAISAKLSELSEMRIEDE